MARLNVKSLSKMDQIIHTTETTMLEQMSVHGNKNRHHNPIENDKHDKRYNKTERVNKPLSQKHDQNKNTAKFTTHVHTVPKNVAQTTITPKSKIQTITRLKN